MPIRVIGGEASGRLLKSIDRRDTRPTSDRVREALFALLEARGADFSRVLDLYSGTGALGIEALSRGAESADFVEVDAKACEVIRANLRALGYGERGRVHVAAVARIGGRLAGPFTLVVADPPYQYDRAEAEVTALLGTGLVAAGALVAVEHSKRKDWPASLGDRQRLLSRRHGDTALSIYQ